MAGRWKVGNGGQPEWEEGVNAPNQIAPPPGQQAPQGGSPSYAPPSGNTGVNGGQTQFPPIEGGGSGGPSPWGQKDFMQPLPGLFDKYFNQQKQPFDYSGYRDDAHKDESGADTFNRYYNDYHSADRDQVLGALPQPMMHTMGEAGAPVGGSPKAGTIWDSIAQKAKEAAISNGQPAPSAPGSKNLEDIMLEKYGGQDQMTPDTTAPSAAPTGSVAPAASVAGSGPVGAVPPGFDANKWNDPNKTDPKYDVGHFIQNNPNATSADVQKMLDAKYPGQYKAQGSDSVVETKTGDIYDFKKGAKEGLNQPQWTGVGNINDSGASNQQPGASVSPVTGRSTTGLPPGIQTLDNNPITNYDGSQSPTQDLTQPPLPPWVTQNPDGTTGINPDYEYSGGDLGSYQKKGTSALGTPVGSAPAAAAGSSSGSSSSSSSSGAFGNPRASGLYDILAGRAGQGLDVSSKDPVIANQVNAFRAEQERGTKNALAAQAESQGPLANLSQERRLGAEHAAQATGGLQAQLMGSELTARRQEIQNALTQMGSMLTSEQQMALQRELGMIDASLRQQSVTNQNNQFLDQTDLNAEDRASYWDAVRRGLI